MRFVELCDANVDHARVDDVRRRIRKGDVEVVRFVFADQHGILRGKALVGEAAVAALDDGCTITSSLLLKDTSHRTVFPIWSERLDDPSLARLRGASDVVMVPDATTFRRLPWAPKSAWILCDLYHRDGTAVPLCTRRIFRDVVRTVENAGYAFVAGLEVEFHLFKLEAERLELASSGQPGEPPAVGLLSHGYQYLTETRYDRLDPIFEVIRENLEQLEIPPRSMELEFGPSQCEFTFAAREGIASADAMVFFRSAMKQICRRHGYHVTFMCRPRIPNVMSSGWHLHQSLRDRTSGDNAFASAPESSEILSDTGRSYLGGLLANAPASAAFATPTINGYRRYRPNALAPERATWGIDHRAAMARVIGIPGHAATHIENRLGEPATNPYLYMASQLAAGMHGIRHATGPGPENDPAAPRLPTSLGDALDALERDACLRDAFGAPFVDYFVHLKRAEVERFNLDVTEWEQREYFDIF